jgi:LemA protein
MLAVVVLLIVVVGYVLVTYNRLVRLRALLQEGWSGIDVQLKRRADLVPNLVQVVRGYAGHEKGTLEEVTKLRSAATSASEIDARASAERSLGGGLKQLFALAEAYPDLKANSQFLELQKTLSDVEDQLQYARRYYNGTVRNFNTLVQMVPSNFIASFGGFTPAKFFELEYATERQVPDVQFAA